MYLSNCWQNLNVNISTQDTTSENNYVAIAMTNLRDTQIVKGLNIKLIRIYDHVVAMSILTLDKIISVMNVSYVITDSLNSNIFT